MGVNGLLPTLRVHAIDPEPDGPQWLVQDLWGACAVGVIGGAPKACKSMMGLDLAISVASATPCLDRFEVHTPGPVLVYLAEDALPRVRDRVAQLCLHRGLSLQSLNLHVVTAPSLRLDLERDQHALDQTLAEIQPRLLLLDPLVRLHRLDENSAADVSGLLGFLRHINRRHQLALVLVHHMAKRSRRDLGQALRGSSDLHAWTDSACYLVRRNDQRLQLTVEHRSAPAPDPVLLRLISGDGEPLRLLIDSDEVPPLPLAVAIRYELRRSPQPVSRTALRRLLRVNNARLGEALQTLEKRCLVVHSSDGWHLPPEHDSSQTDLFS
ncbi:MAG: AAA family ATPase [SAR202 cluster bacterium]|nr:AAA family ATPase [SAR202 cluster bacterium]MQG70656.1 AAA family ATPase [SAR202 cluster bacterium]